jgi:Ni/Co efflux regulator RcnB
MKNRLAKTLLATAAIAAFAVPVGAQARQGADDPAGHVRHAAHQTSTTASSAVKHRTQTRDRHRHGGRHDRSDDRVAGHRRGRGADDATNERRGRGTDDGPNHS